MTSSSITPLETVAILQASKRRGGELMHGVFQGVMVSSSMTSVRLLSLLLMTVWTLEGG